MFGIDSIIAIVGIALCVVALLSVASLVRHSIVSFAGTKLENSNSTQSFREEIRRRTSPTHHDNAIGSWNGYRDFVVGKVEKECVHTTSLYLKPADGKPIPGFKPGQHITLRFKQKGKAKPVVRCYSLSCGPGLDYYRISVRHVKDRDDSKGPGVVSTIVNEQTKVGDRIPIKAPSGHFYLDDDSNNVVVLLSAGIGITPMVSMLDHLVRTGSKRSIVLLHGSPNGTEQQFKQYLKDVQQQNANVHVISCYSKPLPEDVKGQDYQVEGFVSIDLLKAILPGPECEYYLCGPPGFMSAIYSGLEEWGVEESNINFEQFGPSTIKKDKADPQQINDSPDPVAFTESDELTLWNSTYESILELAESIDVPIESGCRAGSCGTCETAIVSGKVRYMKADGVKCNPGCCLPCVAVPDGPLELEI